MGQGINEQFSDNPNDNVFGTVTGSATVTQFPSGVAKLIRFKADPANIGVFSLVLYTGVDDDDSAGSWPLSAGDDTGWVAAPYNVNGLGVEVFGFSNPSGTADYLHYWLQR